MPRKATRGPMSRESGTPAEAPGLRPISHFDGARDASTPMDRLREVRRRAEGFREEMLAGPQVRSYRSFGLVRVPYPTRFGLRNACSVPTPYLHILNRLFIIQFDTPEGLKTLLVSPSDAQGNAETPFFKRLADGMGPLKGVGRRVIAPELATVEQCLAQAGVRPEQVDYLTYDHLHTQDLRKWLGSADRPGLFPNAKLLVMRREWDIARGHLPWLRDWYHPRGTDGVPPERVVLLDGDVMLGDSVALLRTPGHTEGNHSIVAHTPEGLMVTSENGIAPEAYAPLASEIPGVRRYALQTGAEVVLNANTLENSVDQYLSMVQEKTIAGPSVRHPDFPNVVCSSELTGYWAFPGLRPTFAFGDLSFGTVGA